MSAVAINSATCGYQGYEFGAGSYPDSLCIDGRLHDADHCDDQGNVYLKDEDIPCPMCRPLDAIAWWSEQNECCVEEDLDEAAAQKQAHDAAVSLVTDIRRNRGVGTDLARLMRDQEAMQAVERG